MHALCRQLRIYSNPRELLPRFLESDVICDAGDSNVINAAVCYIVAVYHGFALNHTAIFLRMLRDAKEMLNRIFLL